MFKEGQKVKIIEGLYKGQIGTIGSSSNFSDGRSGTIYPIKINGQNEKQYEWKLEALVYTMEEYNEMCHSVK